MNPNQYKHESIETNDMIAIFREKKTEKKKHKPTSPMISTIGWLINIWSIPSSKTFDDSTLLHDCPSLESSIYFLFGFWFVWFFCRLQIHTEFQIRNQINLLIGNFTWIPHHAFTSITILHRKHSTPISKLKHYMIIHASSEICIQQSQNTSKHQVISSKFKVSFHIKKPKKKKLL